MPSTPATRVKLRKERQKWLIESKRNKPCADCGGIFHPVAMDYHHIDEETKHYQKDPSSRGVRGLIKSGYGIKRVQEELDKCVLLCSNCHRVRHYAADVG